MRMMNRDILPQRGLILCAVSGGADSMYLLQVLRSMGYSVAVAHYNHGLRGKEADRDENFVRDFCLQGDIPFLSEKGDVRTEAKSAGETVEEASRRLRYDFLERTADILGAVVIATAHTADDNAETILLRLTRGAGLKGLGGIPPVRGRIVRPMLEVTRREVDAYLSENHIPHVEDSSNHTDDYARNRIRHQVIPFLQEENPSLVEVMARTAALLRRDEAFLSKLAEDFVATYGQDGSLPLQEFLALPEAVSSRVIRIMAGPGLSATQEQAVMQTAMRGGCVDVPGRRIGQSGGRIVFDVRERKALESCTIAIGQTIFLPEAELQVICSSLDIFPQNPQEIYSLFNIFYLKYENIKGSILITSRYPGDQFRPEGRGCTKTLRQLFREAKIPAWERDAVPVLRDEMGILAVRGLGVAERAAAKEGDSNILRVEFVPV